MHPKVCEAFERIVADGRNKGAVARLRDSRLVRAYLATTTNCGHPDPAPSAPIIRTVRPGGEPSAGEALEALDRLNVLTKGNAAHDIITIRAALALSTRERSHD